MKSAHDSEGNSFTQMTVIKNDYQRDDPNVNKGVGGGVTHFQHIKQGKGLSIHKLTLINN